MRFLLGTHVPSWIGREEIPSDVPLFVSRVQARKMGRKVRARVRWALDSGGFTELTRNGRWTISTEQYLEEVYRLREAGGLEWVAPMDWMVEPGIRESTGLSVEAHQGRTIENLLELREMAPDLWIPPVLQGWTRSEYLDHVRQYEDAGVDLLEEPLVGLGTVCRRQHMREAHEIVFDLASAGLRLHGFGVKITGLRKFGYLLESADSLSWSYRARRGHIRLEGCTHRARYCGNCLAWALRWREDVLETLEIQRPTMFVA